MLLAEDIDTRCLAEKVIGTLQKYDIPATPNNYVLWYEYHAGLNLSLQRTIDAIISNRIGFDEETLDDLYLTFFSSARQERAIRETSGRVLETLQEIIAIADAAGADARNFGATVNDLASRALGTSVNNLKELIQDLVRESEKMAGRSECVSVSMRESANKIESLERNLESALRDATVDGLTGIGNRRHFDAALRTLAGDTMNSGDDLSLLLIDIDHFKRVNDTWGHQSGDQVLCYLAETLQNSIRGEDLVSRYGGEEFAILLSRTDIESAVAVGENIRRALSRHPVQLDTTPPMQPITVSIGAASYEPGEPLTEWVARADAALYCAKSEGRNRVKSA